MDDDEEKEERRNSKSRTAMDLDDDDLGLSQEEGEDALEDDTDYALNYFDNGEDYGGGDDEYDGILMIILMI